MPPSDSKNSSGTQLDDLADDELLEVLVRVPPKTARIIRAVAKRWNSIISSPHYAARLCSNHPRSVDHALFLTEEYYENLMLPSEADPAVLEECYIELSFVADGCRHGHISSTSEDLLLILVQEDLFVCNPFTEESVRLPPLSNRRLWDPYIVCEPNQGHRYRVVNCQVSSSDFSICSVFVSETGRWNDVTSETVVCKLEYQFVKPVSYGGKLYWFNGEDSLVYDPFQDALTFISGPQLEEYMDHEGGYWLGVVNGSLRLSKIDYEHGHIALCYIIIWELDCELGQWILKNKSWFQPDRPDGSDIEFGVLHPTEDVVYFFMSGGIGLHDLSKGSDNFSAVLIPEKADTASQSFLLSRSWRPTPVCYHGSDSYNNIRFSALEEKSSEYSYHSYHMEKPWPPIPPGWYYESDCSGYNNIWYPALEEYSGASSLYSIPF